MDSGAAILAAAGGASLLQCLSGRETPRATGRDRD